MAQAGDLKRGTLFELKGDVYKVAEYDDHEDIIWADVVGFIDTEGVFTLRDVSFHTKVQSSAIVRPALLSLCDPTNKTILTKEVR